MASIFSHKQAVITLAVTTDTATSKTVTYGSTPTAGDVLVLAVTSNVNTNSQAITDGAGGTWTQYVTSLSATSTQFLSVWSRVVGASETWSNLNVVLTLNGGGGTNSWSGTMALFEYAGFAGVATVEGSAAATASQSSTNSGLTVTMGQFVNSGTHLIAGYGVRGSSSGGTATFTDIPVGSTGAGTPGSMTVTREGGSSTLYEAYSDGINLIDGNAVVWAWGGAIRSLSGVLAFADVTGGGTITVPGSRSRLRLRSRPATVQTGNTVAASRSTVRFRSRPASQEITQVSFSAIYGIAIYGDAVYGNATTGLIEVGSSRSVIRLRSRPASVTGIANIVGSRSAVRFRSRPSTAAGSAGVIGSRSIVRFRSRQALVSASASVASSRSTIRLRSRPASVTGLANIIGLRSAIRFRSRPASVTTSVIVIVGHRSFLRLRSRPAPVTILTITFVQYAAGPPGADWTSGSAAINWTIGTPSGG